MEPIKPPSNKEAPKFPQHDAPLPSAEMEAIKKIVTEHQKEWKEQLQASGTSYLYLRRKDIKSPYTVQFNKDGSFIIHTKRNLGSGAVKKVKAIAEEKGRFYAKAVPMNCDERGIQEAYKEYKTLSKFINKRGIVQVKDLIFYPSKSNPAIMKIAMIQELFTCDLTKAVRLKNKTFSKEELKVMTIDLLSGLVALEDKCMINRDIKPANILVNVDPKTQKVTKLAICDIDVYEYTKREYEGLPDRDEQINEYGKILQSLYQNYPKGVPNFISNMLLTSTYEDEESGDILESENNPSSAREVLNDALFYFGVHEEEFDDLEEKPDFHEKGLEELKGKVKELKEPKELEEEPTSKKKRRGVEIEEESSDNMEIVDFDAMEEGGFEDNDNLKTG